MHAHKFKSNIFSPNNSITTKTQFNLGYGSGYVPEIFGLTVLNVTLKKTHPKNIFFVRMHYYKLLFKPLGFLTYTS